LIAVNGSFGSWHTLCNCGLEPTIKFMLQQLSKITQEEKKKNNKALKEFQFAFLTENMFAIEDLLEDNGLFFGKLNKTGALAFFYDLMKKEKIKNKILWAEVEFGYSYDKFPGEHVIEIRYMNSDPFVSDDVTNYKFGDPPRKFLNEQIFHFAFQFKNGKISKIRFPKKVIESIEKFELYN
jgi:hypothetical protein